MRRPGYDTVLADQRRVGIGQRQQRQRQAERRPAPAAMPHPGQPRAARRRRSSAGTVTASRSTRRPTQQPPASTTSAAPPAPQRPDRGRSREANEQSGGGGPPVGGQGRGQLAQRRDVHQAVRAWAGSAGGGDGRRPAATRPRSDPVSSLERASSRWPLPRRSRARSAVGHERRAARRSGRPVGAAAYCARVSTARLSRRRSSRIRWLAAACGGSVSSIRVSVAGVTCAVTAARVRPSQPVASSRPSGTASRARCRRLPHRLSAGDRRDEAQRVMRARRSRRRRGRRPGARRGPHRGAPRLPAAPRIPTPGVAAGAGAARCGARSAPAALAPTSTASASQQRGDSGEHRRAEAQRVDLGQAGIAAVADVGGIGRHLRDHAEDELRHQVHQVAAGQRRVPARPGSATRYGMASGGSFTSRPMTSASMMPQLVAVLEQPAIAGAQVGGMAAADDLERRQLHRRHGEPRFVGHRPQVVASRAPRRSA